MRQATAIAAVVLAFALGAGAMADVPYTISYQGVLRDELGVPLPDGSYDITFRLYDVDTGGAPLWEETQTVALSEGLFSVHLGSSVSFGGAVDFAVPYSLGIAVEGESEMAPRHWLTSAPYAFHAAYADEALSASDDDWNIDGPVVYTNSDVGIGTSSPDGAFDVVTGGRMAADLSNGSLDDFCVRAQNVGGSAGGFMVGSDPFDMPALSTAVYGVGGIGARGGHFVSEGSEEALVAESYTIGHALAAHAHGDGYAGYFTGGMGIWTDGTVDMVGFRLGGSAVPGHVLTADATGYGTWQPAPSGGDDGDWTIDGNGDVYPTLGGRVGIGTTTPAAQLDVVSNLPNEALYVTHGDATPRVAVIERTSIPDPGNVALSVKIPFGSPDGSVLLSLDRGGAPAFYVMGNGRMIGSRGAYLTDLVEISNGQLLVDYYGDRVAEVSTVYAQNGAHVLHVECPDTGVREDGVAVYGKYVQAIDGGIGGKFEGGYIGAWGVADTPGGSLEHVGVLARATGGGTYNYGLLAHASTAIAYAGYFTGNVVVEGTLTADAKMFKIDHPLDPANKYLTHACVESDEMKNVYDGVVVLDDRGEARVTMPDWFEAVNGEFRYQLTCIGAHAPVFIAEEIAGGAFAIAGGTPGMKVSWQVTGVRHDAYAVAHRMDVVQDKPSLEIGTYRHPELYGMPETAGLMYREERGVAAQEGLTPRSSLEDFRTEDGE